MLNILTPLSFNSLLISKLCFFVYSPFTGYSPVLVALIQSINALPLTRK